MLCSLVEPANRGASSKHATGPSCALATSQKSAPLLYRARHIGRDVAALLLHLACKQAPSAHNFQLQPLAEDNGHQRSGGPQTCKYNKRVFRTCLVKSVEVCTP